MIAIAKNHGAKLLENLRRASRQPVLGHHQNAKPVAGVEHFRRVRIMRRAKRIAAKLPELLNAKRVQSIRQRRADTGMIAVVAHAFDLERLVVEKKTTAGVPAKRAD